MSNIQKIKTKRTPRNINDSDLKAELLDYGEPLYVDADVDQLTGDVYNRQYLLIGNKENNTVENAKACKLQRQSIVDFSVFYHTAQNASEGEDVQLTDDDGMEIFPHTHANKVSYPSDEDTTVQDALDDIFVYNQVPYAITSGTSDKSNKLQVTSGTTNTKYYILGINPQETGVSDDYRTVYFAGSDPNASENQSGIYYTSTGVLMGAAWNDYAERRQCETTEPGTCVVEVGDGSLRVSDDYLLPGANIISDTYGMCIGDED